MARGASRSEVFEEALTTWLRSRRREKLEEELEFYYRSLDAAEREEDSAWANPRRSSGLRLNARNRLANDVLVVPHRPSPVSTNAAQW
jgi:hypothetical protein